MLCCFPESFDGDLLGAEGADRFGFHPLLDALVVEDVTALAVELIHKTRLFEVHRADHTHRLAVRVVNLVELLLVRAKLLDDVVDDRNASLEVRGSFPSLCRAVKAH